VPLALVSLWRRRRVDLLLLAVAATWGASYLSAKALVDLAGVPQALSLRYLAAAAGMLVVWLIVRPGVPTRRALGIGLLLGVSQASVLWLETAGVQLTDATNAGLLISLTIVFTPILESAASRRWLPRSFFVAAVLAVVGVLLLVSADGIRPPSIGDLLILAAAVVRAVHVTATGRLVRPGESTLTLVLVQLLVGSLAFTVLAAPGLGAAVGRLGVAGWANVAFLGLGCSVFAFVVQAWAIRRTSAARAALLMGTEPIWAVAVGVGLGGERLGIVGLLGAAAIIAATYAGQAIEARHRNGAAAMPHPLVPAGAAGRGRDAGADTRA
jgi:drug/metabolite transporter (DMT)-like permease